MSKSKYLFFIFSISLLILHPYTIYGKPAFVICFIFLISFFNKPIYRPGLFFMKKGVLLILISFSGVISSFINNIPQFNHFVSSATLLVLLLVFYQLTRLLLINKIQESFFLKLILSILLFNCIIILIELFYNPFRIFIESYLDPLNAGTINYAEGYKFRGLASSGGAGLSIILPIMSLISAYLLKIKELNLKLFLIISILILISGTLIGRTGLIQTVILNFYYIFHFRKSIFLSFISYKKQLFTFLFIILGAFYLVDSLLQYYNDTFGLGFTNYAFKFFLDGRDGLDEEGTVPILLKYVSVLPTAFPHNIIGYGFYGGSPFSNWTDSGFARTFLSLGFPLGFLYYLIIFVIYTKSYSYNTFLFPPILIILFIAELKEPLLYSGIASRVYILLILYYYNLNNFNRISFENRSYYSNP